jgi:dihydrofolate reductase
MLAQCSVFIATSLDGFIARNDGSIDWLMKANTLAPAGEDCGYKSFFSKVDAIIMGRHSFEKVLSFDPWPYGEKPVIVLSSQGLDIPDYLKATVTHSTETPRDLVTRLTSQNYKQLYIDGGVTIQTFLAEQLINELTITLVPVLLGSGRRLFGQLPEDIELNLIASYTLTCGFVQVKYQLKS